MRLQPRRWRPRRLGSSGGLGRSGPGAVRRSGRGPTALCVYACIAIAASSAWLLAAGSAAAAGSEASERLRILAADLRSARTSSERVAAADAVTRADMAIRTTDGRVVSLGFARAELGAVRSSAGQSTQAAGAAVRLALRLERLAGELPADGGSPWAPRADGALLSRVLAQRDFRGPDPLSQAFARFVDAVQRWLSRVLGISFAGEGGASRTSGALLVVLVVGAVAIIAGVGYSAMRGLRRAGPGAGRQAPGPARPGGSPPSASLGDTRAAAQDLARRGDLTGAIRMLFGSIPARLERIGVFSGRSELTNREMLGLVRLARPGAAETLARMTEVFDRVFYGEHAPSESDWRRFLGDWEGFETALAGRGGAAVRPDRDAGFTAGGTLKGGWP